jgi:hypothetical protein
MIELNEEQIRALEEQKTPLQLINPRTREVYVLMRQDVYQLACSIISGPNRTGLGNEDLLRKDV